MGCGGSKVAKSSPNRDAFRATSPQLDDVLARRVSATLKSGRTLSVTNNFNRILMKMLLCKLRLTFQERVQAGLVQ